MESIAVAARQHGKRFWPFWAALLITLSAAAIGFDTALQRLAVRWIYPYDHGYLVVLIGAWLLVLNLRDRPVGRVAPSFVGVFAVLATAFIYVLFELLDFTLGMQTMIPLSLLAMTAALGGLEVARRAAAPLLMLYFAIPIWDVTIRPLQEVTIATVTSMLQFTGPIAHIEGAIVTVPAGVFEIAEGCAGMNYFIVGLILATFLAASSLSSWRRRFVLVAVAGAVSLLSNWIRVYSLIVIGETSDMQHYLIAEDHTLFGWAVFVVCMAPVLWLARALERRDAAGAGKAGHPESAFVDHGWRFLVYAVMVAAAFVSPAFLASSGSVPVVPRSHEVPPQVLNDWRPTAPAPDWQPAFRNPFLEIRAGLENPAGNRVDIYLARYLSQHLESKLTGNANRPSPGWETLSTGTRTISMNGAPRRISVAELSMQGERRLLWYWYVAGGRPGHNQYRAKLLELSALFRGRRDGSFVAISTLCDTVCGTAEASMAQFVADAGHWLDVVAKGGADD